MAGSFNFFDAVDLTGPSEYDSRYGTKIDTLQLHHATTTSLSGLISLMKPGGRTVSANGAMGNDGHLVEVVPVNNRAFTSATTYDRRCLTVEVCNTSLAPNWGISDASHRRAGKLAAAMYKAGMLGSLSRTHIIGHREVPGTYATACPGPSFNLDLVVQYAKAEAAGTNKENDMSYSLVKDAASAAVWVVSLVTGRRANISGVYHVQLLQRLKNNTDYQDPMLSGELDVCQGYLNIVNPPAGLDVDALVKKIDAANDDETTAILAAIGKIPGGAAADPAAVAAAVDKVLKDDFEKVNLNIDSQAYTVTPVK